LTEQAIHWNLVTPWCDDDDTDRTAPAGANRPLSPTASRTAWHSS